MRSASHTQRATASEVHAVLGDEAASSLTRERPGLLGSWSAALADFVAGEGAGRLPVQVRAPQPRAECGLAARSGDARAWMGPQRHRPARHLDGGPGAGRAPVPPWWRF